MPNHLVTLNYTPAAGATPPTVTPSIEPLQVRVNDHIRWRLAPGVFPPGSKARVRVLNSPHFSPTTHDEGGPQVVVTSLPVTTSYECAAFSPTGEQLTDFTGGGTIEPEEGTPVG